MAAFLGSSAFFAHVPVPKPQQLSCSQVPRPPPTPPSNRPIILSQSQTPSSSPEPPPSPPPPPPPPSSLPAQAQPQQKPKAAAADSTDWIASSLTRRFGLGAGLAWVAFLAFGVVSEQIKTRFEASQQEANTKQVEKEEEVVLPNGIRYYDVKIGGGATPRTGDLVVIDLQGRVQGGGGPAFVDTFAEGKRPLALVMGSRPYAMGMCEGVEYVMRSMKAGGKRRVVVPPGAGFGDEGAYLETGDSIPPGATLEFVVQVDKVSVAPS